MNAVKIIENTLIINLVPSLISSLQSALKSLSAVVRATEINNIKMAVATIKKTRY